MKSVLTKGLKKALGDYFPYAGRYGTGVPTLLISVHTAIKDAIHSKGRDRGLTPLPTAKV